MLDKQSQWKSVLGSPPQHPNPPSTAGINHCASLESFQLMQSPAGHSYLSLSLIVHTKINPKSENLHVLQ